MNRKRNSPYLRKSEDYKWWNKDTPERLAELMKQGYKVVIFT